jgi:hypothetical protein
MNDKDVIAGWLRLYNVLNKATFRVVKWPDQRNRMTKDIDALCEDDSRNQLAIEHTLIQPFAGERADRARFLKTLASLENHPKLVVPGYFTSVCQAVGSVPIGIQWSDLATQLLRELSGVLPALQAGKSKVPISVGNCTISLIVDKHAVQPGSQPSFTTGRFGVPAVGPELVMAALDAKIPKLAAYTNARRILLMEDDSIFGSVEDQFTQLPPTAEAMLRQIDAVWKVDTSTLETESFILTNDIWPTLRNTVCSLNLRTGEFWQASH